MRAKSAATLQLERDRAIRKERRERKRAEREAKHMTRARRQATHESIERNGIPKVKAGDQYFGFRDAITYSPLVLCRSCISAIRENELEDGLCVWCRYGKEVRSDTPNLVKAQGDKPTGAGPRPPEAQEGGDHD